MINAMQRISERWSRSLQGVAEVLLIVIVSPALVYAVLSINNLPIA